ncbi:hypothetical protein E4V51_23100, partial [Paenibacillus sp. 28ISP30-2]|nr:hypothetical protein [Paenibacillus sp. 28ISP30-2]
MNKHEGRDLYLKRYCNKLEISDEVIIAYSKHIEKIAHTFIKQSRNRKELKSDLVQQGYLGLLEARKRYDASINTYGFWPYASKFVYGKMKDFTIHYTNQIRPSKSLNSIALKIYRNNLITHSPEYIADFLDCT